MTSKALRNKTKLNDFVSVKDFGAIGDGVADDTTAIHAALNSGAKSVHFVPGSNYRVTAPLTVPAKVFLQGNGANIVCGTHFKVLNFTNGGGVFNLNLSGPGGAIYAAGSVAIACMGTNNAPAAPTYVVGPVVENCEISGFGEYGVFLGFVKTAHITGNKITSIGYAGIGGVSCQDVIVTGCVIKTITPGSAGGDAYGIFIDRDNGTSEIGWPRSYRCIISNNTIENVAALSGGNGQGIDTHAGVDFVIDSNVVLNCQAGIYLTASTISGAQSLGPIRCVVSNNVITGAYTGYGLVVYGARNGLSIAEHATDCVVSGNILTGHGWKNSGTVPGMLISVTKNLSVIGNIFKKCGGSCVMLDYQNITFNISGNTFVDPQSDTYTDAACVLVYSLDNRGFIGGNVYRREDAGLATYVAVNAVRIQPALSGLDIDFGKSSFQGIDGTNLAFSAATTAGVRYSGLDAQTGSGTIVVATGVGDGITDFSFPKTMPYAPQVTVVLRHPFDQGGKFPILGVSTEVPVTRSGFRVYAKPVDGATWTATGSLQIDWKAE